MAYKIVENLIDGVYKYGNRELYSFVDETTGKWTSTSWKGFLKKTEQVAMGLLDFGVEPGEMVAVCSPNCPQMLSLDYALFMIRAVSVPVNHLESQKVFDHIMDLTRPRVVFVGDRKQYEKVARYNETHPDTSVRKVVIIWKDAQTAGELGELGEGILDMMRRCDTEANRAKLQQRIGEAQDSDLATVIFTTGTTGTPKGVMLGHEQLEASVRIHNEFLGDAVRENMVSLSYLPMSHIFEKGWLYICVNRGLRIVFCYDMDKLMDMVRQIHPDVMCCVPRFWEKLYTCYYGYYKSQSWLRRKMIERAFHVGKLRNIYYRRTGRKVPGRIEREYRYWDRRVFVRLRNIMGLSPTAFYPTAGSMLNDKIMGFMLKAGFDILLGYGLTETTASVSIFPFLHPTIGTVGPPLRGLEVKIADDGEVRVKGPTVMRGYFRDEEGTRAAFDEEGYLRTGDLGYLTPRGHLVINGRIKEVCKTSTGRSIPCVLVENTLMESPLIDRAVAVADVRKYVTALIYPNMELLREHARRSRWASAGADDATLLADAATKEYLMEEIGRRQAELSEYMHVRNIAMLPRDLLQEKGELTLTGKVRRKYVRRNFLDIIDTLYPEDFIEADPLFESHQPTDVSVIGEINVVRSKFDSRKG